MLLIQGDIVMKMLDKRQLKGLVLYSSQHIARLEAAGVLSLETANSFPAVIHDFQSENKFENLSNDQKDELFLAARMANEVYDISSNEYLPFFVSEPNSTTGFKAKAYFRNGEITIVYTGTDGLSPPDWDSNFEQILVFDSAGSEQATQYQEAKRFLEETLLMLKNDGINVDKYELTLIGHSLGGGLAQYAGMTSGVPVKNIITFNSAGLSGETFEDALFRSSLNSTYNLLNTDVTHVVATNDPVSKIGTHMDGRTITVEAGAVVSHSVNDLINAMQKTYY